MRAALRWAESMLPFSVDSAVPGSSLGRASGLRHVRWASLDRESSLAADPWYAKLVRIPWTKVFPNVTIPQQCMDPVALNLLQYLPAANLPGSVYQGVPTEANDQDQFTVRVDHKINDRQNLSVYYYYTDASIHSPFYNFQASGANVPGYGTQRKAALSAMESEPHLDPQQCAGQ